ncbi:tetratricopeptide repeat protein [Roseinatronobacter alkalisoli]|uniref:Tetratricopeptide repeat protein n=1 Tax=Roseinatronobacter alkalisoli TaxID=3028235 RepID=A0ABT5T596_9RHOB|nr:tetratricopeptide repeat protein [Roseinatronobacter sp. HJB301]MDD7970283.1 tetratricopeptide repeat protein [Roseinatronobacter sp. HJB301]
MIRILCVTLALVAIPASADAQLRVDDALVYLEQGEGDTAVQILVRLAARGDVLAQYNLGVLALTGQGGMDNEQAAHWLHQAAQAGYLRAQTALADLMLDRQDWAQAAHWYEQAAQAGDVTAQFMSGFFHDQALAGQQDLHAAAHWYEMAATQGHLQAQFALATLLAEQDKPEQAAHWFEHAALQGHAVAQFELARALAAGDGLAQDRNAARGWYLRAARAGFGPAMYNLALMQARGQGGHRSYRVALAWALNAQAAGHDPAQELIYALRDVMHADAQADAAALAQSCMDMQAEACD